MVQKQRRRSNTLNNRMEQSVYGITITEVQKIVIYGVPTSDIESITESDNRKAMQDFAESNPRLSISEITHFHRKPPTTQH